MSTCGFGLPTTFGFRSRGGVWILRLVRGRAGLNGEILSSCWASGSVEGEESSGRFLVGGLADEVEGISSPSSSSASDLRFRSSQRIVVEFGVVFADLGAGSGFGEIAAAPLFLGWAARGRMVLLGLCILWSLMMLCGTRRIGEACWLSLWVGRARTAFWWLKRDISFASRRARSSILVGFGTPPPPPLELDLSTRMPPMRGRRGTFFESTNFEVRFAFSASMPLMAASMMAASASTSFLFSSISRRYSLYQPFALFGRCSLLRQFGISRSMNLSHNSSSNPRMCGEFPSICA